MTINDMDEAERLHRESLHGILFDLRAWMQRTVGDFRREAARKRERGCAADSRSLCEQADGIQKCLDKLQQLRKQHLEHSNAKRVQILKVLADQQGNCYEPSQEEIEAKCKEIQSGWSERERQLRHWQQVKPVDTDPTAFIF